MAVTEKKRTPEEIERIWGLKAAPTAKATTDDAVVDAVVTAQEFKQRVAKRAIEAHGGEIEFARALIARPMPKEWKEAVRRFSPDTGETAYLDIFWKKPPSDIKDQKLRLVVYEMVPAKDIPSGYRMLLEGTPYWELPKDKRAGRGAMVSAFQWEMYRTRRVWARPFWCIQGDNGGTPLQYTELEKDLLRLKGQPTDPPHLGALKFAPWDARVEEALKRRDRLYKFGGNVERMRKDGASPEAIQAEYDEQKKQFRRAFYEWWGEQLQEQTEFLAWYETKCESDHTLRRATKAEMLAAARLEETFIEHGYIPQVNPFEND